MTEAANGTGPAAGDAARVEERPEGLPAPVRRVRFDSIRPYLLEDVTKAPRSEAAGTLYLPEGEAEERPGVVVVQGLGGPKPEREDVYGAKLAKAGYAALVLDSFEPRGLGGASDKRKALQITTWALLADAFAAMRFLGDQPGVSPRRDRRDRLFLGAAWSRWSLRSSRSAGPSCARTSPASCPRVLLRLQHPADGRLHHHPARL